MKRFTVVYKTFSGVQKEAEVRVDETTDKFGRCYYATNLQVFGCGKNDADPIGCRASISAGPWTGYRDSTIRRRFMTIEVKESCTVVTGGHIEVVRWIAIKGMLNLESLGMKTRGGALRPRIAAELKLKPRDSYVY